MALDLVHCRKRAQTAHESGTPCCDFALHLTHPHRPTRCTGDPVGICPANPEVHALSPGHDLSSTRRPTTRYCGLVQPRETRYVLPGGTNQSHRLSSLGGHILTKNPRPKTQLMGFPLYRGNMPREIGGGDHLRTAPDLGRDTAHTSNQSSVRTQDNPGFRQ